MYSTWNEGTLWTRAANATLNFGSHFVNVDVCIFIINFLDPANIIFSFVSIEFALHVNCQCII